MQATIKANRLNLNKRNELSYDRGNTWCPMGNYATKDLLEALNAHGDDMIQVGFHSYNDKTAEQDKKTYSKRLASLLPQYTFSGWQVKVVNGHTINNVFVGTLSRSF